MLIHSYRKPLPAFLTSSFKHNLATAGFHSCSETVFPYPSANFRLIGSLRHMSYQSLRFNFNLPKDYTVPRGGGQSSVFPYCEANSCLPSCNRSVSLFFFFRLKFFTCGIKSSMQKLLYPTPGFSSNLGNLPYRSWLIPQIWQRNGRKNASDEDYPSPLAQVSRQPKRW
jgi:hypothetical protein